MASFFISSSSSYDDIYKDVNDIKCDTIFNDLLNTCDSDSSKIENDLLIYRCEKADIPIIITAPHGGYHSFGNQSNRLLERDTSVLGVIIKKDLNTLELSAFIDQYIRMKINRYPHYIGALFHRKYIDANRNDQRLEDHAYNPTDLQAMRIYRNYHDKIDECISHMNNQNMLLLDIHGFRDPMYSNSIVIGTRKGTSCDLKNVNERWVGFCFHLRHIMGVGNSNDSVKIFDDISKYSGASTLELHGRTCKPNVDAIQLEFAFELRLSQYRNRIGELVAEAIIRTLYPMKFFTTVISGMIHWNDEVKNMVDEKLSRIGLVKPADFIEKQVNVLLGNGGFKRFRGTTLDIIKNVYQEN